MKYDEKDVPKFKEDECSKCRCWEGHCKEKGNHWFLMCPRYFNWKIGYTNFLFEAWEYNRTHPEEAKKKQEEHDAMVKAYYESKKVKKSNARSTKRAKTKKS